MRVLIADRLPDVQVADLRDRHQLRYEPGLTADELPDALGDAQALVVRSTKVDAAALEAGTDLEVVLRAGAGTDTIDTATAAAQGVAVCNLPGRNAEAVAELTIGLMLSLDRRIPEQVRDLNEGSWRKGTYAKGARGIAGRRVGVIGLGSIGLAVAQRLVAFDAEVLAPGGRGRDADRQRRIDELGITEVDDLHDLVAQCDIVTFHLPATDETRGLIGAPLLEHLRPGTMLINTSRGDLIDAPALLDALDDRELLVGLDVYPDEPAEPVCEADLALARHPRVHGTHHIGASTAQAQESVAQGVIEVLDAIEAGELPNCVNAEALAEASS